MRLCLCIVLCSWSLLPLTDRETQHYPFYLLDVFQSLPFVALLFSTKNGEKSFFFTMYKRRKNIEETLQCKVLQWRRNYFWKTLKNFLQIRRSTNSSLFSNVIENLATWFLFVIYYLFNFFFFDVFDLKLELFKTKIRWIWKINYDCLCFARKPEMRRNKNIVLVVLWNDGYFIYIH